MPKIIVFLMLIIATNTVGAAAMTVTGTIHRLPTHSSVLGVVDINYLTLYGVSNFNGCRNAGSPAETRMRIKSNSLGDKQYALALAARLSNRAVIVSVDPALVDSEGFCFLRWIDFAD